MEKHDSGSPTSVIGFTCTSSELDVCSPRGSAKEGMRSPVSLLSLMLNHKLTTASSGLDSFYDECDDTDDDCDSEGYGDEAEHENGSSVPDSGLDANVRASSSSAIAVPSVLWLKEPLAVNELRRMHYERWHRRMLMEKEMAREQRQRNGATNVAQQDVFRQQQLVHEQWMQAQVLYQQHLQQLQQQQH